MALTDSLGIDIGTQINAPDRLRMAAEAGARLARISFALGEQQAVSGRMLDEAREATSAARDAGLRVLAVVDGDLTVAPGGARAFEADGLEDLAEAWRHELVANVTSLAAGIGADVAAWEILPSANVGEPGAIAPARYAALLGAVGNAIREATPDATVIAGGLVSNDADDAVDYLQAVYKAGGWSPGDAPFDGIGIRLLVAQDSGQSEEAVGAALAERTRRLWRVVENIDGPEAARDAGIYVTGVSWDAEKCGEDAQGRNTWTALDVLTADPVVHAVVWSALVDTDGEATGLCRTLTDDPGDRRPAWQAFKDFSIYLSQISPAGAGVIAALDDAPAIGGAGAPGDETKVLPLGVAAGVAAGLGAGAKGSEPGTGIPPTVSASAPDPASASPGVEVPPLVGASLLAEAAVADVSAGADAGVGGQQTVEFAIPTAEEVLAGMGLDQRERDAVLAAVTAKYGGHEWLPPGSYEVSFTAPEAPVEAPAAFTNQQVISAMYRVGGGTWSVLERSGLQLSELAARRDEPYRGPSLAAMPGLTDDERERVQAELDAVATP